MWGRGKQRVFAYPRPCDMRKSFNTLSGLVVVNGHPDPTNSGQGRGADLAVVDAGL